MWLSARSKVPLLSSLMNHRAPSGPAVICAGSLMPLPVYVETTPDVVILPIESYGHVGEPQGAVWSGGDSFGEVHSGAGVVGDDPGGGDPPDRVVCRSW